MIPDGVRNAARYPTRFGWIQNSFGIAQSDADLTAGYDKQMVVPMSMHFNGASAATDFDALTALWEASVRATHHFLDEAYIRYLKPLIRNEYLKSVELYGLRGNDGAIVAFMGVSERKIEMLFVDPAFREMGLGRHLVEYAIDRLHVTRVDVNEQNEQAAGFYARLGFRYVSRSETDGSGRPYPILHLELPHSGM